jgi:hypothetical protein
MAIERSNENSSFAMTPGDRVRNDRPARLSLPHAASAGSYPNFRGQGLHHTEK